MENEKKLTGSWPLRDLIIAQPRARRPRSDDGYERSSEVSNMCATLQEQPSTSTAKRDRSAEPSLQAARSKRRFLGDEHGGRSFEGANGFGPAEEIDFDFSHLVVTELDVADALPLVAVG